MKPERFKEIKQHLQSGIIEELEDMESLAYELWDENKRLRAIVDKLPKTADGVPMYPTMRCWNAAGVEVIITFIANDGQCISTGGPKWFGQSDRFFSTREAAKAAQEKSR